MGVITEAMLDTIKIKWAYLSSDENEMIKQLNIANEYIERNESFFFIVKKDTLGEVKLKDFKPAFTGNKVLKEKIAENTAFKRMDVLSSISKIVDDKTVVLATTGKTGRELYEIDDADNNLYMVGSMGCTSSMGLGLALSDPAKKVISIDGDAALLMRMGNLATNAYYSKSDMLHILIDNNMHDSTGGQFTVSNNVDFVKVAAAAGYHTSLYIHSLEEFETEVKKWLEKPILTFMHVKVVKGTKENLGRPKIKPYEVKDRLIRFINGK
jgi:phosphonopyruvate decarboxylase